MRTVRLAAVLIGSLAFTACGSDTPSATSVAGTSTPAGTDASTDISTTTLPPVIPAPTTTVPGATVPEPAEGPVQFDVRVGVDSRPSRIEYIRAGADVTLNIINPNAADEFHVHGIDLEQAAAAGVMATMNFVLDTPGDYEVESHISGDVLIVLRVV